MDRLTPPGNPQSHYRMLTGSWAGKCLCEACAAAEAELKERLPWQEQVETPCAACSEDA